MKPILPLMAALALSACASVTSGSTQSVLVDSKPAGARCELSNDKGTWTVGETPESVTVTRAYSALTVTCRKGKHAGAATVESTTNGTAFGNILLGGVVGAAVDMSSGAAYQYPPTVIVSMAKE